MGLDIFKLEKLTIQAFKSRKRDQGLGEFKAMYNPTEIAWKHSLVYDGRQALNSPSKEMVYAYSDARRLSVVLVLDGTGVDEIGLLGLARATVKEHVDQFKKVTFDYDGDIHEPPYLRVTWGAQETFDCRLRDFTVKYTMFNRDGSPLRAELAIELDEDIPDELAAQRAKKSSPDLSHVRVVRAGDTLPLLTRAIYGSSSWFLDVARYNGLDDVRALKLGQRLFFPPLHVLRPAGGGGSKRG